MKNDIELYASLVVHMYDSCFNNVGYNVQKVGSEKE